MDQRPIALAERHRVSLLPVASPTQPAASGDDGARDLPCEIAEAEERGDWGLAAELRRRITGRPAGGKAALRARLHELSDVLTTYRPTDRLKVGERVCELQELYRAAHLDDEFVATALMSLARDVSLPTPGFEAAYHARRVCAAADHLAHR